MSDHSILKLIKRSLFTSSTALLLLGASSSLSPAEPLSQALEDALNHHPTVTAAIANRDALKLERKEFSADYFPTLSVTATAGRTYADNSVSRGLNVDRGAGYSWLWERNLTVNQPIFTGFETENKVMAAQMRKESANFGITDVREQIALQTILAYTDVMRTEEALANLIAHRKHLNKYIEQIKKMISSGAADESMMLMADDIIAQLDNTLADHKAQANAALANYEEITGHLPTSALIKPDLHLDALPETIEDAVAQALESHTSLKAADMNQRALEHDREVEKSALYPSVSGEFSYLDRDQKDLIGGESEDYKAVVRMNWDFSLGGRELTKIEKAQIREQENLAKKRELERRLAKDVRVTFTNLKKTQSQNEILNSRVRFAHKLFQTYQSQFKGGRVDIFQLLQSDNQLFTSKLTALNSDYALIASHYSLLASLGRLQDTFNVVPVSASAASATTAMDHGETEE